MSIIDLEVVEKKKLGLAAAANGNFAITSEEPPRAERCVPSCIQVGTCGSLPGTCITLITADERRLDAAIVNTYNL